MEGECLVDRCNRSAYCKKMCQMHYYRMHRTGTLEPNKRRITEERVDESGNNWCARCREYLPLSEFGKKKMWWCRTCTSAHRFSISKSEYLAMFDGKLCPICNKREKRVVDHDHSCCPQSRSNNRKSCGKCIRGALCIPCNAGLANLLAKGDELAMEYIGAHGRAI